MTHTISSSKLEVRDGSLRCACSVSENGIFRVHVQLLTSTVTSVEASVLGDSYAVPAGCFQAAPISQGNTSASAAAKGREARTEHNPSSGEVVLHAACGSRLSALGEGLELQIQTASGGALKGLSFSRGTKGVEIRWGIGPADRFYGLGERSGFLDKRGRSYLMWNTDEPFHHELRDPLYQSVPFVIHRLTDSGADGAIGLFLDDPGRSVFDLGESDPGTAVIRTERNEAVIYLLPGENLFDVTSAYTWLTGRHELPPRWALGYQQCRYSYYPDSRVLEIADEFRRRRIPCDVIYLDIHYMDGYRVFTWDPERFPDPQALIARLHEHGFRVVTIVDPGVKIDPEYDVYLSGSARNVFARQADGAVYAGEVWPGAAVFPDFLRQDTRAWWASQHHAMFDVGVDGIWNDMNEPADFTGDVLDRTKFTPPGDLMLDGSAGLRSIDRYHNVYGQMMCAATADAFAKQKPELRPLMVTRAGYAGIQRYAAVWTGDNDSSWAHLSMMIPMLLNMGLSGIAFCGSDVGGFQGNASGELFARWMLSSCFTPFFRAHTSTGTRDHEPWAFGAEVEGVCRRAILLRGRLLPYIYSLFDEYRRTGRPLLRPMLSADWDDPRLAGMWNQFLVGADLLVAPVLEPEARSRVVYLPAGRWYRWDEVCFVDEIEVQADGPGTPGTPGTNTNTDNRGLALYHGGQEYLVDAPLDRIPVFVRAGAVLPLYARAPQYEADSAAVDAELVLCLFADTEAFSSELIVYDDDRESQAYLQGEFRRERLLFSGPAKYQLDISTRESGYDRRAERYRLQLYEPGGKVLTRIIEAEDGVYSLE